MKIQLDAQEISSLLVPATKYKRTRISSCERATQVQDAALRAFARWGHLRTSDLARAVWPHARYAEQLSGRLVIKLEKAGLVIRRPNAVGGMSYVLTRRGAANAESLGCIAHHGLDLCSVAGATFIHRSIATRYGIEAELQGRTCFGEHLLAGAGTPFTREALRRQFGKLPDLFEVDGADVWWVEVESAAKARAEVERCLLIARHVGRRIGGTNYRVHRLVFVCDGRFNHEKRIIAIAKAMFQHLGAWEIESIMRNISFVRVRLGPRARWLGAHPATLP